MFITEWSGEVRNITYSADGKTVSVVYRVTIYGTDAEVTSNSVNILLLIENLLKSSLGSKLNLIGETNIV